MKNYSSTWKIVRFARPFQWQRQTDGFDAEVWLMQPRRRYVLSSDQLSHVQQHIESMSALEGSAYYRPLQCDKINANKPLILVERRRDRGIGDFLFMTGPLNYINHKVGGTARIDMYMLSDRSHIFFNHPLLSNNTPFYGPTHYDDFVHYDHHWMVESATEHDSEPEQLNVYDALYKSIGVDYTTVGKEFKRPHTLILGNDDLDSLNSFYYFIYQQNGLDLRKLGYYAVAPLTNSSLRSASYSFWLETIQALAERRPVVVLGVIKETMPSTDMSFGDFYNDLNKLVDSNPNVINVISQETPMRLTMALIAGAKAVVCLDSAPLYIAQAFRTPAISMWGSHHPGVRIGYDKDYMDLAIWRHSACRFSPCFSYAGFPEDKCPDGQSQKLCECLARVEVADIVEKINQIES